ncbi:MAG: GNAT family N-acetyltransferase [Lachnospiraceae bacterium]|nr:GNAT family N-acetyltransferase [Lachnospiraceae bacterium]
MLKKIKIKSKYDDLRNGLLYVTDDLRLLQKLREVGEAAAAVLTPENRDEDFSGVPYAVERMEELEEEDWERLYRRLAHLPWQIAETERCRLREMTAADTDRLYEIYADTEITRYMEPLFEERDKERRYIEDYRKYVYEFYGYGMWVIEEKASGQVIGRAGIEAKEETLELGYMVALPWQGKGIAYEACGAVLEYVRREIGSVSVTARTSPANLPSIRLLEKLGFWKRRKSGEYFVYEKTV